MIQGSTTRSGNGVAGAAGQPSKTVAATVRWVVLFTGHKATEDYQPASSEGEDAALIKEVTQVCVALHPHSEIRLFRQSGEALLYYRAESTGEAIITRVSTAPNPDGVRTALEYSSLVLSESQFQTLLGGNPFAAARSTDLFDRVRDQFLSGSRVPVLAGPSVPKPVAAMAEAVAVAVVEHATALDTPDEGPRATPENIAALEARCAAAAASGARVPTFATWWSSSGAIPSGIFEVVLRAPAARALTLHEVSELLTQFAADVKSSLPKTSAGDAIAGDLARTILASADAAQQAVTHAALHINTETPAQFQSQLTEAARHSSQIAADVAALIGRLGTEIEASDAALLMNLSTRAEELGRELPRVRHPNPFARRNTPTESTTTEKSTASTGNGEHRRESPATNPSSGRSIGIGIGAVAALAVVGFGVWGALGHRGEKPSPSPTPVTQGDRGVGNPTIPNTSGVAVTASPTPHPTPNPMMAALTGAQKEVGPIAQASAKKAASAAVTKTKGAVDESEVETIASDAITAGYKEKLSSAQYDAVYGGEKSWTYARYQSTVPALAYSVRTAAHDAVVEGVAALKIAAATVATPSPTPSPTPTPEPTPRPRVRETPEPTPKPRKRPRDEEPTPRPRKNTDSSQKTKPAPPRSTPPAGTAGQTGL